MSSAEDDTPTRIKISLATVALDLQYIKGILEDLSKRAEKRDQRIDKIEDAVMILKWVGATLTAIMVAVAIDYVKGWLGLG